jgi:hypothetical protein
MLLLVLCSTSSHRFLCTQLRPTTALLSSLSLLSFFALLSPKNTRTIPHSHPTFTQLSSRTCLEATARARVGAHFRYLRTSPCPSWFAAYPVHAIPAFLFGDPHHLEPSRIYIRSVSRIPILFFLRRCMNTCWNFSATFLLGFVRRLASSCRA